MFRIIPHRALIEPKASVMNVESRPDENVASLRIEGLLCSACAANVRGRLERLDGVREATVDLETGEARVTYDPARCTPDAQVDAVAGAVILRPLRRLLALLAGHRSVRTTTRG